MADGLLEAVRGLWLADFELGPNPLLTKLRAAREQQPDLAAGNKEVRETLTVLRRRARPRRPPPPLRPLPQQHPRT